MTTGTSGEVRMLIELPKIGIKGNSHMMMMARNNREIADVVAKWLADKGFSEP
jgi:hypothetical protein